MEKQDKKIRYGLLDTIRGLVLISMIGYHFVWDLIYLCGRADIYQLWMEQYWQPSICYTFILLSGFCFSLGSNPLKRGAIIAAAALILTTVTMIFLPDLPIRFGILHLLGFSMIFLALIRKAAEKIPAPVGMTVSLIIFLLVRNISTGMINIGSFRLDMPEGLYINNITACFGFPGPNFYSADYFPVIPWFFLFLFGYFSFQLLKDKQRIMDKMKNGLPMFSFLGKHSLMIYMIHQPILYLLAKCFFM